MGLPRISGRAAPLEATYSFVATQLALSSAIIVEEHQVFLQTQPFGGLDELPVPIENPSPHCLFRLQQVFVEYKRAWAKILDSQERTEAKLMQLFPPLFPESLRRAKLVSFASTLENTKKLANSALVREVQQTLTSANPAPAVDNKAKQIFAQWLATHPIGTPSEEEVDLLAFKAGVLPEQVRAFFRRIRLRIIATHENHLFNWLKMHEPRVWFPRYGYEIEVTTNNGIIDIESVNEWCVYTAAQRREAPDLTKRDIILDEVDHGDAVSIKRARWIKLVPQCLEYPLCWFRLQYLHEAYSTAWKMMDTNADKQRLNLAYKRLRKYTLENYCVDCDPDVDCETKMTKRGMYFVSPVSSNKMDFMLNDKFMLDWLGYHDYVPTLDEVERIAYECGTLPRYVISWLQRRHFATYL